MFVGLKNPWNFLSDPSPLLSTVLGRLLSTETLTGLLWELPALPDHRGGSGEASTADRRHGRGAGPPGRGRDPGRCPPCPQLSASGHTCSLLLARERPGVLSWGLAHA